MLAGAESQPGIDHQRDSPGAPPFRHVGSAHRKSLTHWLFRKRRIDFREPALGFCCRAVQFGHMAAHQTRDCNRGSQCFVVLAYRFHALDAPHPRRLIGDEQSHRGANCGECGFVSGDVRVRNLDVNGFQ